MEKINNLFYYIIIMLLFLFFAFYYHSHILFVLLFAMLIFPFFSILITKYTSKKLSFNIEINHYYCHIEKQYFLKITAENPTPFPVLSCNLNLLINNFYYPNDIVHTINMSIPALHQEEILVPISFRHCGCYTAEIKDIEIKDFLAVTKSKSDDITSFEFNVFPVPLEENISTVSNELSNEECLDLQKSTSGTQFDGIRNYIAGDPLKNIHWKLSAKAEKLLAKEFNNSIEDSVIILMELYTPALTSVLSTGFSTALALIKQGQRVHICWANAGDEQLKKQLIASKEDIIHCFSDIFLSYPSNTISNSLTALRREYDGKGIVYINAKEKEEKAVIDIL